MTDSILTTTKKALGISAEYTAFDLDIIMHINSVFSTLNQLGVGPASTFMILDDTETWADFIETNQDINSVRTYMYLRVRLYFDPPATSFAIAAMEKQIEELGWRLNVQGEGARYPWIPPEETS